MMKVTFTKRPVELEVKVCEEIKKPGTQGAYCFVNLQFPRVFSSKSIPMPVTNMG